MAAFLLEQLEAHAPSLATVWAFVDEQLDEHSDLSATVAAFFVEQHCSSALATTCAFADEHDCEFATAAARDVTAQHDEPFAVFETTCAFVDAQSDWPSKFLATFAVCALLAQVVACSALELEQVCANVGAAPSPRTSAAAAMPLRSVFMV
ncbi:MAG: hypothetical protein AAF726_05770 [Planctomycetota bacterium]